MGKIVGFLDSVSNVEIKGWAAKLGSDEQLQVKLVINNKFHGKERCLEFREDLVKIDLHPTGKCGFTFKLQPEILAANDEIRVIAGNPEVELKNSPWKILNSPTPDFVQGRTKIKDQHQTFRLQPQPLICTKNNLGLIWSAKSGCTFAAKWFFYQIGLLEAALYYHPWVHRFREEVFYDSLPYKSFYNSQSNKPILWIKVVRSPFTRAVSSYVHAVKYGYENMKIGAHLKRKSIEREGFSFREFVDYLRSIDITHCNLHHMRQFHPIEETHFLKEYQLVRLEESIKSLRHIERSFKLATSPLDDFRNSVHNSVRDTDLGFCGDKRYMSDTQTFPTFSRFYDDDLVDSILGIYQLDFEKYGYSPDINDHKS